VTLEWIKLEERKSNDEREGGSKRKKKKFSKRREGERERGRGGEGEREREGVTASELKSIANAGNQMHALSR